MLDNPMSIKEKWQDEAKMEGIEEGIQPGIRQGVIQATAKVDEVSEIKVKFEETIQRFVTVK